MMPDLTQFWMLIYGGYGYDAEAASNTYVGLAGGGVAPGGNPPYTLTQFSALYPKFIGPPATFSGTTSTGMNTVTVSALPDAIAVGQLITGPGIPDGTIITAVNTPAAPAQPTLNLSNPVGASATTTLTFYPAPLVPLWALQLYINLASASLSAARWRERWVLGVGLYVAHLCTLWLQSEGNPQTTAGQVVSNALQTGILVSESAGGVSASYQLPGGLAAWGMWGTTLYGSQLIQMSRAMGAGLFYFR